MFALAISGDLRPKWKKEGQAVIFANKKDQVVLQYDYLHVFDAEGEKLSAVLAMRENVVSIRIDDRDAVYPITIDPLIFTETKLVASDGAEFDSFGSSVAISGDLALIGAIFDEDNGNDSGSAYVYRRDGLGIWNEEAKLLASDGAESDKFGISVAISGDLALIGAFLDDDNGPNSGSVYVYKRDVSGVWSEETKLLPSDGMANDEFGRSVSISGDFALIGSWRDDDNGDMSGSAYVYKRDASGVWSEEIKLLASDGEASDNFGISASISGDLALIGAILGNNNEINSGSAYIYALNIELNLARLGSLIRGQETTLLVTGANPGERVLFFQSETGVGSGPCPTQLGGLCLDLLPGAERFATKIADDTGSVTMTHIVADSPPGTEISIQAVIRRGIGGVESLKSNTITDEVLLP